MNVKEQSFRVLYGWYCLMIWPSDPLSCQAIGEPPFLGSSCVLFALQDALYSALRDAGHPEKIFTQDTPLTAEKIRIFCQENGIAKIA